jgi:protoporphyrinogen oxidase
MLFGAFVARGVAPPLRSFRCAGTGRGEILLSGSATRVGSFPFLHPVHRVTDLPHVLILGAGPAGLGAAHRLRALGRARVTVVEKGEHVGGNAASFELGGQWVDFGSHRLHPACDPVVLADIKGFLGPDLRERPRHGRIRIRGRWVRFPLRPWDLAVKLDPSFQLGALRDAASRMVHRRDEPPGNFGEALLDRLGPTICEAFYFPYARKIWGLEPEALSTEQAQRRVSANTPWKLVRKILAQFPGLATPGAGRFYYPRKGFGQIADGYAEAAREGGAELILGWGAEVVTPPSSEEEPWTVVARRDGEERILSGDHLWSTIPLTLLAKMIHPKLSDEVLRAASVLRHRAMVLVYLELLVHRFTPFDAHYFPGKEVLITRLSEPKNYSGVPEPRGRTVLCAELPCSPGDAIWNLGDEELGTLVQRDLESVGLPLGSALAGIHVRRLRQAYPIYEQSFRDAFSRLDSWASGVPRLLSFGRQGLFAHDNTHHALAMAYAAADCLEPQGLDAARWRRYRMDFETHVVED